MFLNFKLRINHSCLKIILRIFQLAIVYYALFIKYYVVINKL